MTKKKNEFTAEPFWVAYWWLSSNAWRSRNDIFNTDISTWLWMYSRHTKQHLLDTLSPLCVTWTVSILLGSLYSFDTHCNGILTLLSREGLSRFQLGRLRDISFERCGQKSSASICLRFTCRFSRLVAAAAFVKDFSGSILMRTRQETQMKKLETCWLC